MINHLTVTGFIQGEMKVHKTPKDTSVHTFLLKTKQKESYTYYQVNLWGNRFEGLIPYLKDNKPVLVIGDLRPARIYKDKNGENRVSMQIDAQIVDLLPREGVKVEKEVTLVTPTETVAIEEEIPF